MVLLGPQKRKETTMFHQIEFCWAVFADVERPDYAFMQRMVIKLGERLAVRPKPYVAESANGPVEVADLYLEDGTILKEVRYAAFRFNAQGRRDAGWSVGGRAGPLLAAN
jgi:hypothetical protein